MLIKTFKTSNSSIWLVDETLTSIPILVHSEPGSNDTHTKKRIDFKLSRALKQQSHH